MPVVEMNLTRKWELKRSQSALVGDVIGVDFNDNVFTNPQPHTSHEEEILLALTLEICYTKQAFLWVTNWKPLKFLL